MRIFSFSFLAVLLGGVTSLFAGEKIVGTPWTGKPGITETVEQLMQREALTPQQPDSKLLRETHPEIEGDLVRRPNPLAPNVSQWPPPSASGPAAEQVLTPQPIGVNFRALMSGPAATESNFIPPDSMGDVGPTQILAVSNGRIRVFSKTGVLGALNVTTDNFFASVRGASGTSDPHIRYDRFTGRWFVVMVNVATANNLVLIAVSSGPTITDQSSFTFFQFQQNLPPPAGDSGSFADYPTLGVDRFALYIGVDMFATTLQDTSAFVVNKANLLAGTLKVTAFRGLTAALTVGPFAPQGVDNDDPQATEGYFIGVDVSVFGQLDILRVSDPGGTPTMSAILLTVPNTASPLNQVAEASVPLDAVSDRLFAAEIHKNKITGQSTLWTAQNIAVDLTGTAQPQAGGDRNGSRWYEIGNMTGTPTLIQAGTLFDPAPANPRGYWMDSVVGSGQGHMALGCSYAGAAEFAGVAVAGRLRGDPLGSIQAASIAKVGLGGYNQAASGRNRWGDYSQTVVDPNDDMTLWTFQEYAESTATNQFGVWGVQVTQLIAPPPATPAAAVPSFVPRGAASNVVTVTGTSVSGSEFFDPGPDTGGPGYANHIAAAVSGGVTVGSVTFDSPTQVRLDVSTVAAACGTKDVTVTNPDGQSRAGSALFTTVPPPPSASNGGPVCAGQTLQLSASSTAPGATYAWTGPNGFTSTDQNPVIANATTAASGTYSVTVTVGGCASGPTMTTATVNPSPDSPAASNNGPICEGATLQLMASTVAGATYSWTGPNGFTSSAQNPSLPNATPAASGNYRVTVTVAACPSAPATTTATVTASGAACNDGNLCTTNDACSAGSCAGQPVVCTASDQCHVAGTCDPGTGACSNPAAPDGTACNDANVCTRTDTCQSGVCVGSSPLRCDDFNDCTTDTCDPQTGCVHSPISGALCDDHNSCTANDTCSSGTCVGTPLLTPAEVTNVRMTDRTTLVWNSAAAAGPGTVHDVVRGLTSELPVGSGASEICLASGIPEATTMDTATPVTGRSFWYLVRGHNACARGTYGFASNGTERVTAACP